MTFKKTFDKKLANVSKVFKELETKTTLTDKINQDLWKQKVDDALSDIKQWCTDLKTKENTFTSAAADITTTIQAMEKQIQNAKTAADTAAAAKKAAEELAAQVRANEIAERAAKKAKAEADRLATEKTQLERQVTNVTDELKKCEE